MKVYKTIASLLDAIETAKDNNNDAWLDKHEMRLESVMQTAPSGSGIDNGIHLIVDESDSEKLTFQTDFHHMNSNGFYDGWTYHKVRVTPSFMYDADLHITGRDRNLIKEHIYEVMRYWLLEDCEIDHTTDKCTIIREKK